MIIVAGILIHTDSSNNQKTEKKIKETIKKTK